MGDILKRRLHIQYNSPVILSFSLASLIVLLVANLTSGASTALLFSVYRSSLLDPLTYIRFFTHVLGHGSYAHYISNILLLLVVGPPMEEKYGGRDILICIVITSFISGLVQWIFLPGIALIGASGIVFMLIVLSSLSGMREGGIPLTLIFVVIFYLGGEIVAGITLNDNVSQVTHIIGGVCGAAFGYIMFRKGRKN